MVLQSIYSVLSLLVLILLGVWLYHQPWFGKAGGNLFSKFAVRIAIPCYMFHNIITTCENREKFAGMVRSVPVPFFIIVVSFLLGLVLARVFRIDPTRRAVFINAISFSNIVIMGFPVIESLFGPEAIQYGMVFYLANTVLFWTLGAWMLRRGGGQKATFFSLKNLKSILNPAIIGLLLGSAVVITGIELPPFIATPVSYLRQCTTGMSMVFIGTVLAQADFSRPGMKHELVIVCLTRFVFSPVFVGILCALLPIPTLQKQTFFILGTMPAMTQLGIMAKETNCNEEFASVVVTLTTALSMLVIPVYMFIMNTFHLFG